MSSAKSCVFEPTCTKEGGEEINVRIIAVESIILHYSIHQRTPSTMTFHRQHRHCALERAPQQRFSILNPEPFRVRTISTSSPWGLAVGATTIRWNRSMLIPNLVPRKRRPSARLARMGVTCTQETRGVEVMPTRLSRLGSPGSICRGAGQGLGRRFAVSQKDTTFYDTSMKV